jgi:hypothetical protein
MVYARPVRKKHGKICELTSNSYERVAPGGKDEAYSSNDPSKGNTGIG